MDSKANSRNEQPKRAVFCSSESEQCERTASEHYHYQQPSPAFQPSPPSDPSERPWMTTEMDERSKQHLMTDKEKQSYEQQV
jgi:hypothetical protein